MSVSLNIDSENIIVNLEELYNTSIQALKTDIENDLCVDASDLKSEDVKTNLFASALKLYEIGNRHNTRFHWLYVFMASFVITFKQLIDYNSIYINRIVAKQLKKSLYVYKLTECEEWLFSIAFINNNKY